MKTIRRSAEENRMRNNTAKDISLKKFLDSPASLNFMYIPALLLFSIFIYYPLTQGIKISFTNWNGYSAHYSFVGLQKYIYMFTDMKMYKAVLNTLIYGLGSTLFQNILGLAYAVFLNGKIKGKSFIRMLVYFPAIIAPLM